MGQKKNTNETLISEAQRLMVDVYKSFIKSYTFMHGGERLVDNLWQSSKERSGQEHEPEYSVQ